MIEFFNELQKNSLIRFFSDKAYHGLVTIAEINLNKGQYNSWVAEELFYYSHPFLLPDLFQKKLTKHEFNIAFQVLRIYSSVDIEKIFDINHFFQTYPSTLNNKTKTEIKKYFIKCIQILEEHELIDSKYKIISKGNRLNTVKLTNMNISKGFIVYEKLFI